MRRVLTAWNRAIAARLMNDSAEAKDHSTPDSRVLSTAMPAPVSPRDRKRPEDQALCSERC